MEKKLLTLENLMDGVDFDIKKSVDTPYYIAEATNIHGLCVAGQTPEEANDKMIRAIEFAKKVCLNNE